MRNLLLATVALLAVTACSDSGNADGQTDSTATDSAASTAPAVAFADYAAGAAIGDMYEIESSRLAMTKASSDDVKRFAERMRADHTGTTDALKSHIQQSGSSVALPTVLDARRQGMIDQLQAATGAEFDRMYMMQQQAAHDEALALHRSFAESGDNDQARALARSAVAVVEQHHQLLRSASSGPAAAAMPSSPTKGAMSGTSSGNPTGAQTTTMSPPARPN